VYEHDAHRRRFNTKIALDRAADHARRVMLDVPPRSVVKPAGGLRSPDMELAITAFGEAKLHALGGPPPGPWLTAHGARALRAIGAAQDRLDVACRLEA